MSEEARSDHDQQSSAAQQPTDDDVPSVPGPQDTGAPDSGSKDVGTEGSGNEESGHENSGPATSEKGLSGFFDTLDERARTWWATRNERKAQTAEQAATSASAAPEAEHTEKTDPVALPKPPPPEVRPQGQLFTGAVPVVEAQSGRAASTAAPAPVASAEAPAAADAAEASADDTVVLPAYRDEPAPSSYSPAATSPRPRRALDEQRRRDVIAQKARAIEYETAAYYVPQSRESADDEEDLYTYIPPYNLPSRDPEPEPTRWDLYRRIFVSLGALAALISAAWMFGWLGEGSNDAALLSGNGLQVAYADGWFSGEHALLSPDHNFYWLWPVIVVGLLTHAAFQWSKTQKSTPRQRRSGWLVGASAFLMLAVTAGLHAGMLTWVLVASVLVAVLLVDVIRQFNMHTSRTTVERRLNDGVIGLFFGFALVQAMSSVSVWLTAHGWEVPGFPALLWAASGLFICVWTAAFYSMTERGRITIALGLGWGMFWLIFPRLLAEVTSVWMAIGAAMGAFIVILSTQSRRHWINHAERRAAMGRPLEDII